MDRTTRLNPGKTPIGHLVSSSRLADVKTGVVGFVHATRTLVPARISVAVAVRRLTVVLRLCHTARGKDARLPCFGKSLSLVLCLSTSMASSSYYTAAAAAPTLISSAVAKLTVSFSFLSPLFREAVSWL